MKDFLVVPVVQILLLMQGTQSHGNPGQGNWILCAAKLAQNENLKIKIILMGRTHLSVANLMWLYDKNNQML